MAVLYILCGGRGTRLGAITRKTPKPLIRISGVPFISHLIRRYGETFGKIVLLAGYKGEAFLPFNGAKTEVVIEAGPAGTGGALTRILNSLPDSFFLCNGDTIIHPLELREFMDFCSKNKKSALYLTHDEKKARGAAIVEGSKVVDFLEKQGEGEGHVYTGLCFIMKSDLAKWKSANEMSLEKEMFPALANESKLLGYVGNSRIYDIGTPRGIAKFRALLASLAF